MKRKVFAGTAAALALGGAGAGIAATQFGSSPSEESKAVVSDAAKRLGVEPNALSSALKKALEDRLDAAVAAGRITKEQAAEMKQRIESNDFPLFSGPGPDFGFGLRHHGFPGLAVAASYLGLTESKLDAKVDSGQTLAQVAKDEGKSVDGLVAALKDDLKSKLDKAVSAGRITKADETKILADVDQRITSFVNGKLVRPAHPERWFGDRPGFDNGPPASFPAG